ncbi:stage II sporulation protein M [Clostridium fermenticellae]|uniref:Stage II sporulation protein M n=1 Tax=Clostridium fermenticellae TaxID=2068654 RepID=A0A386H4C5_9CLOT|nr:stage II sporulation protein M [Clostridium fermenticellae]AYD40579.1 stage II sporulation protein M [Clostridium fermenticellae]
MLHNKFIDALNDHVQNNFWLYVISLLCICTGIVLGIYSVRYMGGFEKSDLVNYIKSFSSAIGSGNIDYKQIFIQTIKNNIPVLIIVWFLGLTMIGVPIILIIDILKGFTIGFTISFIINGMGIRGVWVSLLGVLPQNIIYIPCIIFISVLAMEFSLNMLKDKGGKSWTSNIWLKITSYSVSFALVMIVMVVGFTMESYLTPQILKVVIAGVGSIFV